MVLIFLNESSSQSDILIPENKDTRNSMCSSISSSESLETFDFEIPRAVLEKYKVDDQSSLFKVSLFQSTF